MRTYESERQTVPSVFGILNPYLVVPCDWIDWSEPQRRCVLLHELAHVKRWDVATQFVGRLMAVAYWFNPLVWYAKRQLRIERELACDDCVLLTGQKASEYALELLHTLRLYRTESLTAGVAMAHSARLDRRVIAILDQHRSRLPIGNFAARTSILCAAVMTIALASVSLAAKPQIAETRSPKTDETRSAVAQQKPNLEQAAEANEQAFGNLLGLMRRENGKLVMWKADGSPTQSLPVPSELPDEQTICVFEIDSVGELMGTSVMPLCDPKYRRAAAAFT